jgi:hypothetical protein
MTATGEVADQKDPSIPVDLYFPVAEIWNRHADRTASRSFRDLVHDFLRKRIEHNRPGSGNKLMLRVWPPVSTHDCVQGREISLPYSIFALGPNPYLVD